MFLITHYLSIQAFMSNRGRKTMRFGVVNDAMERVNMDNIHKNSHRR